MLPGIEMSTIIEMVLSTDRSQELSRILTEHNVRESQFIKNLLWLQADPDYESGKDANLDEVIKNNKLDNRFLQGMMTALIIVLVAERPFFVNNPNHHLFLKLYEAANAVMIEQTYGCDE